MKEPRSARFLWVGDASDGLPPREEGRTDTEASLVCTASLAAALSQVTPSEFAAILIRAEMCGDKDMAPVRQLRLLAGDTPVILVTPEEVVSAASLAAAEVLGAVEILPLSVLRPLWKVKLQLYADLYLARYQLQRMKGGAVAAALQESTERFELLLNSSGEGIYGMGADTSCTFLNKAGAEMLGYAPEELVGRPIHDVIHHHRADGSLYPLSECKIGTASRTGIAVRVDDEVFWRKDGTAVPVSYSVNPMVIAGKHAGAVITFSDVTERRRVEDALRTSNERVKLATDAGGLGLFTWEIETDAVTWHNDRPYEIFGIGKEGPPVNATRFAAEFVHPDDAAGFAQAMGATLHEARPFYFLGRIYRAPDRALRWVEFTGQVQAVEGTPLRVVGTAADVTLRKQAESALRESEERLRQLANTIPNLAWIANADGYITWYNDRWYSYTGTGPAEMEGWGWQQVHHPDTLQEVMQRWTTSISTGQSFEMTFPLRGADGVFRPFFTLVAPLRDADGKIVQWFGTNTDVSPLKRAEDELRNADRRKDEFLAMLAHELRNPLAPIRNAAELLRRQNTADPRVHTACEIISRQVSHMTGLLNDLLDVSRVVRGLVNLDRKRTRLAGVMRNAVEQVSPLISAKHHRLVVHAGPEDTHVFASPLRLTQVIANLLDNAAKYSPPGADITLTVDRVGDHVVIAVSDTGIGISADLLPYLFEPFSQGERGSDRSQGGLGLGLAVVKGLVELHGGTVTAGSAGPGSGSRFEVVLPVLDDAGSTSPVEPANDEATARRSDPMRVLIVDDNVDAAETLAMLLEVEGHQTRVAFTGAEAFELVKNERFDRVILDIGLPDMTGHELAVRIRDTVRQPPPLVALSGYGQAADRASSLAAGFAVHLVKPIEPDALLSALASAGDSEPVRTRAK